MVIEASIAAGYLAGAVPKGRRVGRRLDAEADTVIDACSDRLHEVAATRLAGHAILAELLNEAGAGGEVSELTYGDRTECTDEDRPPGDAGTPALAA